MNVHEASEGLWDCDQLIVLDSSFNPPTRAHGSMVKRAVDYYGNGHVGVLFLIATNNADKGGVENLEDRIEMMQLLWQDMEVTNVPFGVATTPNGIFVNKLEDIIGKYSKEVIFILGYDTVVRLLDQKYYKIPIDQALDGFMRRSRLYVVTRGEDVEDQKNLVENIRNEGAASWWSERIVVQTVPEAEGISSTLARTADRSVLTARVREYVEKRELY